ncbi:ATP synthase mitochondrial F1 complex assembly factor 1-like [Ornithodoros turicata]|uniref:ATP synthase mitochondrial F1 complex assembly factor 1-like n=1 Tax=Ornithodoros turicata TaxID=34597 RepID=UPI003138CDF0
MSRSRVHRHACFLTRLVQTFVRRQIASQRYCCELPAKNAICGNHDHALQTVIALIRHSSQQCSSATNTGMFVCMRFARATSQLCRAFCDLPKDNPYLKKYSEKIRKLKQISPSEYEERLATLHEKKPAPKGDRTPAAATTPTFTRPVKPLRADTLASLRNLQTEAEVVEAWKQAHADKDSVCALIPGPVYERMQERGAEFPTFVFPVPRGSGYEFMLSQIQGHQCHMTPLSLYKTHGSEAPACLKILHWTDLLEERGFVLMHGEYDAAILGPAEAQCLANQHQLYYGGQELGKKVLLWNFNHEPHSFNHEDLVRELERSLTAVAA